MSSGTRTGWLVTSGLVHGVLFALLVAVPRPSVRQSPPLRDAMEFTVAPLTAVPSVAPVAASVAPPRVLEPAVTVPAPIHPTVRGSVPFPRITRTLPAPPAPIPTPPIPPIPPIPPVLRATDLLHATDPTMTFALPRAGDPGGVPARAGLYAEAQSGSADERASAASDGYVRGLLAASTHREAPGVSSYLWNVRRRVTESWRPGVVRVPNLADTLMAGFVAPERALQIFGDRIARRQRQMLEAPTPREGGAVEAIAAIGGVMGGGFSGRRGGLPADAGDESWRRNTRTTVAEVLVEQDDQGRVVSVRLVHGSGIGGFDRAAVDAVRQGLDAEDPVPLPGGRRSRWSFTVVATRRLFTPSIGGGFDESRGWFQVEVPGQVSLRSRVRMESCEPLGATSHGTVPGSTRVTTARPPAG